MTDHRHVKSTSQDPDYLDWRTQIHLGLALSRIKGLKHYKLPDQVYDSLAITDHGLCFFLIVRGFSSMKEGMRNIDSQDTISWKLDPSLLENARHAKSPVIMLLFDADTDHGRFLRLDTLDDSASPMLRFPKSNTITGESFQRLIDEMQSASVASRAS